MGGPDQTADDLAAFGAPPEVAEALADADAQAEEADGVAVWEENRQTWLLWLDLQTQWHTAGMSGQVTGLDYEAALAVCRWRKSGAWPAPELLDDLKAMEAATLAALAEVRARAH